MLCGFVGISFCYPAGIPVGPVIGIYGIVVGIRTLLRVKHVPGRFSGNRLMAIIGILTGILGLVIYPMFMYDHTRDVNRGICEWRVGEIVKVLVAYSEQHEGQLPPSLDDVSFRWGGRASEVTCAWNPEQHYRYIPNLTADMPPDTPVVYEPLSNHTHSGHIGFLDGTVRFCPRAEYEEILRPYVNVPVGENANR